MVEALKAYVAKLEEVIGDLRRKGHSTDAIEEALVQYAVDCGNEMVLAAAGLHGGYEDDFLETFKEHYEEGVLG